jgi:hypothetical protein
MKQKILIRRMYDGKLFQRYHSYKLKSDATSAAESLRKQDKHVRIFPTLNEEYKYTVYTRSKKDRSHIHFPYWDVKQQKYITE